MEIVRDGKVISLTHAESLKVFEETQHKLDIDTILYGVEKAPAFWGIEIQDPKDETISDAAYDFRDILDYSPFVTEMDALEAVIEKYFCQDLE